jgi:ribosomal-protein-alanine N-acetyltransferase
MKVKAAVVAGTEVLFEPMRRRHLPAVLRIEHRAHPKPWTVGVFNSELAQGTSRYYVVARVEGRVVGYGGVMFVADEAHVTNIAVAPVWRRRHVGARILAHLAAEATRRRCEAMTLEVRMGNLGAQALYQRFGFVAAGVRHNYYPETGEDGLVMWLYGLRSRQVQDRFQAIEAALAEDGRMGPG